MMPVASRMVVRTGCAHKVIATSQKTSPRVGKGLASWRFRDGRHYNALLLKSLRILRLFQPPGVGERYRAWACGQSPLRVKIRNERPTPRLPRMRKAKSQGKKPSVS